MLEAERKSRNQTMLQELHPAFRVALEAVLHEMESYGLRPRIQQAWRSPQEQLKAFNEGHSRLKYGFHNVTAPDGRKEALAADVIDDNNVYGLGLPYILHLAAAAQNHGLTTGVRWDLTPDKVALIDHAVQTRNWNAKIWVGYDPLHVEVTGLTVAEAQAGKRPDMPGAETGGTGAPAPADTTPPVETTPPVVTPPPPVPVPPVVTTPPPQPPPAEGGQPAEVPQVLRHFSVQEGSATVNYDLPTALRPVSLLKVPYQSQLAADAAAHSNDCGPACAVMLLKAYKGTDMTPDVFYTRFGVQGDPYVSAPQIRAALSSLGVDTEFRSSLLITDLFNYMAQNKPVIVALSYKDLRDAGLTETTFAGPHFAVAVGIDSQTIYLHDPLYTDPGRGEAHPYPLAVFWQAWRDTAGDAALPNPARSAIVPLAGLGAAPARRVKISIGALNVRSGPALTYTAVGSLRQGTVVEVLVETDGWGKIGDGQWISLKYTLPAD